MKSPLDNATSTVSIERIKNLKAIEIEAARGWEKYGVLQVDTIDTATTSLLAGDPTGKRTGAKRASALVKRMPRQQARHR